MTGKTLIEKLKIEKKKWENQIYGVGETRIDLMIDDVIRELQTQQEEIFKLQARVDRLTVEIEKKDKVIDLMAKELADYKYEDLICMEVDCEHIELQNEGKCIGDKACMKEYFINKVEKEK